MYLTRSRKVQLMHQILDELTPEQIDIVYAFLRRAKEF